MKSNDLLSALEKVGPLSISEEFIKVHGFYDNSGILIDSGEEITGVVFSLDLSDRAVNEALARGFNAIVTHHPAIYGGINNVSVNNRQTALVARCMRNGITVISMHLNFDAAPEGIDYHLMRGLGGSDAKTVLTLSGGAYGRVYDIEPRPLGEYVEYIKKTFNTQRVIYYGNPEKIICKVASFCGAGCDDRNMEFTFANGADVLVSADLKHHQITALTEQGVAVIGLTHYASEIYGFNKIYKKISEGLTVPSAFVCEEGLM